MDDKTIDYICEQLLHAGWKLVKIERLYDFLQGYISTIQDRAEPDMRHLQFLRWLISIGKLTE
ncbi:hypothetical protein [Dictyobacter arantiisoli]|uniref:Uncharacterized protein n=1 Tax=Dictyobacter arantiisoli TaxID=2014874 RepID=A0A5A5TK63_9CHLR|nr:hypothetical protein [Dictyobacter arantiisoli]GCF11419.1 hypothetical protein KDI_49830 [Dictyobacter arantiisoli]